MEILQLKFNSPIGDLYLSASPRGLTGVYFKDPGYPTTARLQRDDSRLQTLQKTATQLKEYFSRQRSDFDLTFDFQGTEFQKRVWNQLLKIPYGKTLSYKDVARLIRHDKAVRAVGTANGRNPICIIIPCHRVIAADGTLGGYSGGLHIKTKLLDLEQATYKV